MFEKTFPLKYAQRKVRWPLYKLYRRQNAHLKWVLYAKVLKRKSWNFLCLSTMWFSFWLVTFKWQISDDVRVILIKRCCLNFDQITIFHKNEKSKFNETFGNGFLGNKTIKWHFYIKKTYSECAKKVKNVNFNTSERPSWIIQFLGRGNLDFQLFQFFLRKWDQEVSSHQFILWSLWSETML